MALTMHLLHLIILGVAGAAMLLAVLIGRNPLAQAPASVRRLGVAFWVVFFALEFVDVLEARSSAPIAFTIWAVLGLVMGTIASLLMLRVLRSRDETGKSASDNE